MASSADFRNTRFELYSVIQGPNGLLVQCTERGSAGSGPPPLALYEDLHLDAATIAKVIAAWTALEEAFEPVYSKWAGEPERLHELVAQAVQAKVDLAAVTSKLGETQSAMKAAEAQRVAAEADHDRLIIELTTKEAEHAALAAEHEKLAQDVAAKKSELRELEAKTNREQQTITSADVGDLAEVLAMTRK